jgi:small GTP-binding protein
MIGEEYFELRSRLGTDLYTLASLVRESGASLEDIQILDNLIASLKDPFVFVVVGEVNVGKSTLLNALFGADISKTGVMPTTDRICYFKYGPSVQATPIGPNIDEVRVPCDFLKDFHIVDTPGTNSIENEHQQITERFVPMADLVIFVFSAMNPWGASAWHFLDKVHSHWRKNVIFVLQQSDLRTAEEISVIRDYMRQLCAQRFQREFPIFPVSGKRAYLARSSGIDRDRLLAESGFMTLEAHITDVVMQSPARRTKLHSSLRLARGILDQLMERTQSAIATHDQRREMLAALHTERDLQQERTRSKFDAALDATDRDFCDITQRICGVVQQRFTIRQTLRSVKEDERIPPNLDHRINQELLTSTTERWQNAARILEDDHHRYQAFALRQWKGEFFLDDATSLEEQEERSHHRRRFQSKLESALRRFVLGLRMTEILEPAAVATRAAASRLPQAAVLLILITAVVTWFLGWKAGLIALGGSALALGVLLLRIRSTLRRACQTLATQMDQARPTLRSLITEQLTEEIHTAYGSFSAMIGPEANAAAETETQLRASDAQLRSLNDSLLRLVHQLQA